MLKEFGGKNESRFPKTYGSSQALRFFFQKYESRSPYPCLAVDPLLVPSWIVLGGCLGDGTPIRGDGVQM
ncbi:hypothetical protein [Leptospira stimsonii]|uniref:hypothetical protein n=1 Tax=Leptospira stimsonii TaxID=2202203 RepID=UPI001314CFDB|nr:hypothetical protein [Leptospira stimsonii]